MYCEIVTLRSMQFKFNDASIITVQNQLCCCHLIIFYLCSIHHTIYLQNEHIVSTHIAKECPKQHISTCYMNVFHFRYCTTCILFTHSQKSLKIHFKRKICFYLQKFEKKYKREEHETGGNVAVQTQFEYAYCLVRSEYSADIKKVGFHRSFQTVQKIKCNHFKTDSFRCRASTYWKI